MVGDLLPSLRGQAGVGTGQPRPPSLEMLTVLQGGDMDLPGLDFQQQQHLQDLL